MTYEHGKPAPSASREDLEDSITEANMKEDGLIPDDRPSAEQDVREAARVLSSEEIEKIETVVGFYLHHPLHPKETAMKRRAREVLSAVQSLAQEGE